MRVATFRWTYLLAAAAAFVATFPLFSGEGTWRRIVSSTGSATIAFFGVEGLAFLVSYRAYRKSGYKNPFWESACRIVGRAELRLRWTGLSQEISALGVVSCKLRRPGGAPIQHLGVGITRGGSYDWDGQHSALTNFDLSGDGQYKVRWYADPLGNGHPLEVCRASYQVENGQLLGVGADGWAVG